MEEQFDYIITAEERAARRAERTAARAERNRKKRKQFFKNFFICTGICLGVALCVGLGLKLVQSISSDDPTGEKSADKISLSPANDSDSQYVQGDSNSFHSAASNSSYPPPESSAHEPEDTSEPPFSLTADKNTVNIGKELSSKHAIVIDLNSKTILAQKAADTIISPASMTKILTILVAAEHIKDPAELDNTVTIDLRITDYCYTNECSVAGFVRGEEVTVRNLFYGTILPSGADAALGLANYIAGSQENFVVLMNEKVEELGLSETAHFTNCIGLYNKKNVCTVYDIAMILRAAMENELCRQILTTKIYEIPASTDHPDGMILSNWFLRRIEDYVPDGMEVIGAKTGYVSQAGNCAASIALTEDGSYFICVTANTTSSKQCVQDHVQLYTTYLGF